MLFLAIIFFLLKLTGFIELSWMIVILSEFIFLLLSYFELKFIYKKINNRFQ